MYCNDWEPNAVVRYLPGFDSVYDDGVNCFMSFRPTVQPVIRSYTVLH